MFKESLLELKKTKSIVLAGILSAVNIALGGLEIPLIPGVLVLSFGFLSVSVLGFLTGPIVCGIAGVVCDLIKFMLFPSGSFFLGFTLNEFLAGFIFGLVLYKQEVSLKRCFIARFLINLIINILLTPLWLNMLYGKAWVVYAQARIIKNLIAWPIESLLIYFVLTKVKDLKIFNN